MSQPYILRRDGRDYQAPDLDTLRQWARDGRVLPTDMVYSPQFQNWYRARDLRQLKEVLPPPAAAAPAPAPQQFWLRKGDQNYAADSLEVILRWAAEGNIHPDDYIYHPAYSKWFRAGDSPQLVSRLPSHIRAEQPFLPAEQDPMASTEHVPAAEPDPGPAPQPQKPVERADSVAKTVMDFKASDLQKMLREQGFEDGVRPGTQPGAGLAQARDAKAKAEAEAARRAAASQEARPSERFASVGAPGLADEGRTVEQKVAEKPAAAAEPEESFDLLDSDLIEDVEDFAPSGEGALPKTEPAESRVRAVEVEVPEIEGDEGYVDLDLNSAIRGPSSEPAPQAAPEVVEAAAEAAEPAASPEPAVEAARVEPDPEPEPAPAPAPAAPAQYVDRLGLMKLFYDVARAFVVTRDLRPGELLETKVKLPSTGDEFLGQAKKAIYVKLRARMQEHLEGEVKAASGQLSPDERAGYDRFLAAATALAAAFEELEPVIGQKGPERVVIGNAGRPKMSPEEEEGMLRLDAAFKTLVAVKTKEARAA